MAIKLGILKTGSPPAGLTGFGSYPAMFRKLLGEDAYDYRSFDVDAGEFPERPEACAAYIVTGSPNGVYDPQPWIGGLRAFLVASKGRAALVGICFGHQIMAEAFDGTVVKSPRGWGLGAHSYDVLKPQGWMDAARSIRLPASHQDQVVVAPPTAEVIAASGFAPLGMLAYRDQPAISLQLHPEFAPDYAGALVESCRGDELSDAEADRALASLREPDDRERVGGWIRNFLAGATGS